MNTCGGLQGAALDITRLLPHRPPFLLVESVAVLSSEDSVQNNFLSENFLQEAGLGSACIRGQVCVREDNPFVNAQGELEPIAYAEMLAQCAGALGFLQENAVQDGAQAPLGYLASLRDVRVWGKAKVGDVLHLYIQRTATVGQISVVEGAVFCQEKRLCSGQLKIFVEEVAHD